MYFRTRGIHRSFIPASSTNTHKTLCSEFGLRFLTYHRQLSIQGPLFCGYLRSSFCHRGCQRPLWSCLKSYSQKQSVLSTPTSRPCSLKVIHHQLASLHSSLRPSRPLRSTQRNVQSSHYAEFENHKHDHINGREFSALFKYLTSILASLGLSYIVFKTVSNRHHHIQTGFLPVAACASQEPSLAMPVKLEVSQAQQVQSSAKAVPQNSCRRKVSGGETESTRISLAQAVHKAQELCKRRKDEVGSPGIVICVSVDGKQVYAEGFGYADLENRVPMKPNSVLRIASISKAITATIVAKIWEKGQIDIEKPVQDYVPSFPQKEFMGEKVEITVQQLLNHTSGIRHYKPKDDPVYAFDQVITDLVGAFQGASLLPFYKMPPKQGEKPSNDSKEEGLTQKSKTKKAEKSEMDRQEYYLMKHFSTTDDSLQLFSKDPLIARPGTKYVYTTFGYTLLAAVVEFVLKKPFMDIVTQTLGQMGLRETYFDLNDPIIYNRARYYIRDAKSNVVNAPYVDNSYKWAGGGLLSTAEDIVKFGNILLYSAQHKDGDPGLSGFLKSSTVWKFWDAEGLKGGSRNYALGFSVNPDKERFGMCENRSFGAGHTGGAVGASSALYILPRQSTSQAAAADKGGNSQSLGSKVSRDKNPPQTAEGAAADPVSCTYKMARSDTNPSNEEKARLSENAVRDQTGQHLAARLPQGIVVCIMLNMISVSAKDIAEDIARVFENVDFTL